jgi:hypothetical protein
MKPKKKKETLPVAVTSSPGAAEVEPAVTILPEAPEETTQAAGQVALGLFQPVGAGEAVEAFTQKFGAVTHSLDRMYQGANTSMQSLNFAAGEAFRRHYELGVHFCEDLAVARTPVEVVRLQAKYLSAQAELFVEQSKEFQRQFAQMFLAPRA